MRHASKLKKIGLILSLSLVLAGCMDARSMGISPTPFVPMQELPVFTPQERAQLIASVKASGNQALATKLFDYVVASEMNAAAGQKHNKETLEQRIKQLKALGFDDEDIARLKTEWVKKFKIKE